MIYTYMAGNFLSAVWIFTNELWVMVVAVVDDDGESGVREHAASLFLIVFAEIDKRASEFCNSDFNCFLGHRGNIVIVLTTARSLTR